MSRKKQSLTPTVPLNFLLGCSESALGNFQLAKLNDVANLRKELHVTLDKIIESMAQVTLARWFKENDRQSLKRALETEEDAGTWAKRLIRDEQKSEEEIEDDMLRNSLEPGRAASVARYAERNIAEGKCAVCPLPLDRNSIRFCTKHLTKARERVREKLKPHRTPLAPGAAHRAASLRYAQRNIAAGKCRVCPQPLTRNSVELCEKHLAMSRAKNKPKGALSEPERAG